MIMSGHIVQQEDLPHRTEIESTLSQRSKFLKVQDLDNNNDLDGNYIVYTTKR